MATIQEAYQAACNAGFIKRNEFSEEAFGNMLQNDNNRRAYYDHVTKIDPTFYSKDYDTFSQNVLSALGKPNAKNSTNQPSNAPVPSQVQPTFQPAQGQPTFWQSIGAHDPYPQKTAEGVTQFEKEQQLQRESAATMPLSQQDKDRQAEIQRLQTEGTWGKPNGITMDIDKQTGLPTINQTEGDGMHLSIGATLPNQDEIDRLKAEQPSYITREIKTPQDLYTSVSEAWAANTPDGQKAKAELDKTAQDTYNNLLADMNRQIADLQQQVNNGTVTQQQAQQEAQRIADNTNAVYENEMQLAQDYFFRQMTDANADYLSQQARLLGQKATNQTISDINARIAPHIRQLETERQQAMQRASQSVQAQGGMYGAIGASISANTAYKPEKDQELALYHQSQQFLADAAKISDAAQKGEGFWKGLGKSLGDIDTWDFGISQLTRSANLKDIVEKYERGEQLTDAEKGLMDSAVAYMSACAYNSDKINRRYKMGQTTGESIPFMLQFMVMPIGAIKDKVAKGVLGYGIEQFGGKAAQATGKAAAKYGAKTAFKEAGTALLGNLAAAGVQTAAFGVPKIAEGAISRMTGDIQPTLDEQGNIAYNGRRNQQSAASAVWNSAVDMYAENLSEMILTSLDPLKAYAGTAKLFSGLKNSQIAQVLGRLNEGVIGKVRDRVQFRNYLEEVGEEYVGNLIRWGLSTDVNNAEDAGFSADQQIDTWLGLAPTSIAFVGAGAINSAVSGGIDRFQSSRAAKRLREIMADGDKRRYLESLLKSRNSDDFSKNAHEVIKSVLRDKELNEDTKRLIMDGIYSTYQSQLAQEAEQARTQAEAERQAQPEQPETANVSDSAQPQTQAQVQVNTEGEEHYQDADGNEVTFYRNADGSVTLRDKNGNAAVDEQGNAVTLTQTEFDQYARDTNLRRVDRELTPEQWAERENQLRQQYEAEVQPNTHNDGNVYEVVLASDVDKRGYIVGDGKVEIDNTTDPAVPRITNADVVTVRYEDGTMAQVAAKDLNLVEVDSAEQIVEDNLQPFQQYAQAMQTFRTGQEVTMDDGSGKTYTSRVVSVSEDGVEVEIEDQLGNPTTWTFDNATALTALQPVEQAQPAVDIANPKPIGTNKFGTIYQWVVGKAKEAAQFLFHNRNSYLKGVFHRDDIGDIDLVWGNDKAGFQHIIKRHILEQTDFGSINDAIEAISKTIQNGRIVSENDSQCTIDDGTYRVAIAKDGTGNWVVTAYDNSRGKVEKQRGNTNSPLVVPSTEQNNPSDVAFSHQENGDTSMSNLFSGKDTTNNSDTQVPAPNIDTMSPEELGASAVEFMGGVADGKAYLEAERDKADTEVKRLAKQKINKYTDAADFKRQNDELKKARTEAASRFNKLEQALITANNYKTQKEKERSRIQRLLKNGKLAYINKATLPPASDKTIQGDQLTNPVGEELSSADKGTKNIPNSQTPEQKSAENLPNASQDEQSHTEEAPKDEQSKDNGSKEQSQSPKTFAQERTDVDLRTSRGAIQIQETESLPKEIAPKSLIEVAVDDDFGTIVRIGFKNKDLYVQTESKDADGKQWRYTFIVPNARQHAIANIADKFYGSQVSDFADEEREALKDALYKADTIEHLNAMRQGNIAYQKASAQITTETTDTEIHAIAELTEAPERQFAQWVDTLNAGNIRRVAKALNENTSLEAMRALGIAKRAFDRKAREELGDIAKNYVGSTYKLSDVKQVAIAYAADNIYHSDNVPNKEAIEAYVEKIYNEAKAARMTELEAELNKPLSLDDKKALIKQISDGKTKVVLVTNKTIVKKLTELGATRKTIANVAAAVSRGDKVKGFFAKGMVILNTDVLQTGNDIIATYVHERQHLLTAANPQTLSAITDNATADELAQILQTITGTAFYDQYNNGTANGHTALADELVSHIMQEAYATGKDAAEIAQNYGINNETILQTLNNIDYEQRQSNSLSKARRDNILGRNSQSSSRQSSRDNQTQSRDGLVQQGTRPAGKGSPRTPSRGQTTKRGEIADTPVSALSFNEQVKSLKELILFQSKEEEQYFDSILPNLKEDKLGINSIPLEVILHENSIIEKLEGRVSDYIAEHYPTQGSVSALTNSPQGKKEREAMRKDPALAQLRKEVNAQQDAAQRKINGKYEEVKAIADNPSITLGEVAQLWNDALEFSRNLAAENDIRFSVGKASDNLHKSLKSSTFAGKKSQVPKAELAVAYADMFRKQAQGQFVDGNGFAYSANYFHSFERGHIVLSIPIEGNEDYITDYQKLHGTNSITGTFSQGAGHLWRSQRPSTGDNGIPQRQRSGNERVDRLHGAVRTDSASDNQKVNRDTQSDSQTELTDPRFSVSGTQVVPLGERTLVGLHNITSDKLRKVLKAGGLANPSAAVIDIAKQDHHGYGEISLVMPSSLVDSREGNNAGTYTGDMWSPTYPLVERRMTNKGADVYYKALNSAFGNDPARRGLMNKIALGFSNWLNNQHDPKDFAYWYMLENGITPQDVLYNSGIPASVKQRFEPIAGKSLYEYSGEDKALLLSLIAEQRGITTEELKQEAQELRQRYQETLDDPNSKVFQRRIAQDSIEDIDTYGVKYNVLEKGIDDLQNAIKYDGKIDIDATLSKAKEQVQANYKDDFEKWLNDFDERFDIKEYIFDGYTRDGDRKYIPNTLANASRLMNREELQNAGSHGGFNATKGQLIEHMNTLADIRANKYRLTSKEGKKDEQWEQLSNEWFTDVIDPLSKMQKISDNPFSNVDYAEQRLLDALRQKDPIAHLNKEYGYKITKESTFAKALNDLVQRIKDLPAKYFETKFKRPVSLNEFRNAVVPNDLSQDLRDGLEQEGLGLYEYDPETKGSRREATLQATEDDGIRFSVGATLATDKTLTEEARKEMQSIAEQAKADGTYMQAPNGKPSNLTERQWLQVRTRAFKNWFGNWEKSARIEKLRNSEPAIITGSEFEITDNPKKAAIEYGKKLQGYYTNKDTGIVIQLQRGRRNGGINEVLQHNYKDIPHIQSVAAIPQIIEKSIFIDSEPNNDVEKNPSVVSYDHYVCGLKIGDADYTVHALIAMDSKGNRYYDHNLVQIEKKKLLDEIQQATSNGDFGTTPDTKSTISNSDRKITKLFSILQTNSSKCVDVNGEPLVVYHGTPHPGFSIFNTLGRFRGKNSTGRNTGVYTTPDRNLAYIYTSKEDYNNKNDYTFSDWDGVGQVYPLYLNIKNPLVIECDGADFDEIHVGGRKTSTDAVIRKLRRGGFGVGYDGVIFKDVYDGDYTTDYVALSPNQIKSATSNNGSFSENSDDIRFSIIGRRNTPEAQYDELDYDTDNLTDAQQLATDAVLGALDDAGISVERVSGEQAEREVEKEKSESSVRLIRQMAEGTKGQSNNPITSAKVQKNLEDAKEKYKKYGISTENAITDISKALGARNTGTSNYITIEAKNGTIFTLRLSNHNATVANFDNNGETSGISIVISRHDNKGITNNGDAHIVEFFYSDKSLNKADGTPIADIIGALEQTMYSGEYTDPTGLAQRQEVNIPAEPLRTSNGTIYGYAKDGKIYLTDKGFNPNTPIHEYAHLWVKAVRNNNAELYDNLRDLFSRKNLPDMWNELDNDPQYRDLSDEAKLSEIIARFSGKRGAERMEQEAQKLIDDAKQEGKRAVADAVSFRERMRNLLRRFWNWVGEHLFHIKHFGSREEAADRVLYDLLNGTDLHQSPTEKDSQAEFSTSPMPKRMDGEMVHEWAKRIAEWKRQQVDEQQVAEYAKLLDQNNSKKSRAFAYVVDKFTPIDNFQQWVQAQGGVYNHDTMDMHSDISLALGRIETYSRRYKNDYMQRIADSIAQIAKDNHIADPLLALGLKWQNFDNKKMNGKPLTVREIMGVYAQAKDTWEADQQGLSDRGAQGFVKNLGVSHTDIIEAVERIIPQKQLDEFWNAVYAANQFALDYQLNAGMLDTDTRNRYTRRYYVPQRGWRERDFDGKDTAYIKGNGTRLYGNPYNAALVKAHGRESLASDPFALIESIGLTSITQSEHNKSKQQLLNLLLANEMLGLKSGAWRVKQVWSKNVIDPRTGHIMRKPDGTPMQAEVTYAAPTQQEREHDADINAQIEQLRKELRDLTQPTARAKREAEIANLQDQLIYTGRATDTMLEHRTRDERLQHQIIVLYDGQQYVIELQDERLANAVNGNFGEAVKAYALFNKYNAPAIRYISGVLTQYNPRFAHRNFWRDAQAAFLNNLSEQGAAFTTRAMANIPMVQRTVWKYILADTYKGKEKYTGQFGDYLREYFEAGAQTGFSFMPELERMAKDFNKMVKGENAWDKVWGKGVKGTLSLMTEASELTVRFAEYVTARQMGRSVQEAAKLAKNISVNFNQSGLMSKEMSKFFAFFNATVQGNMRFLMPYGKNKPKFGERAFKFGAKFAGMAANFALLGLLSTFLQPDNPDDDTWFTEYDRMNNFILFGKFKIPVVHFFRMFYAAGVQAALAAQGRKTWKDAFYTSAYYALGELVPASALQVQNLWDYDKTTNTNELNPAKYAQAAAPSVISPLVDVAVNRDFKGSTVYRKKWDNDKKDITTAKRNTPQWAVDVSNTLHRWSGGNPDVPYKGGNTDGWIDIKPNAIEHLAQGYFSGVWESLGYTAGFIWDGAHDTDVYKHATNWPFLRDLFRDYSEEKAYNQQYYSVLQKLEKYEKRVNTLPKEKFNAEKQTNRFRTFKQVSKQLRRLPNPYDDEEATVTSEDVNKILQLDIKLNRNLFAD